MNLKYLITAASAVMTFGAAPALAQSSATVPIDVTFSVVDGCVINGNNGPSLISFGTIQNAGAQRGEIIGSTRNSGGAPIIVNCNVNSASATFEVDGGVNSNNGANAGIRKIGNANVDSGTPGDVLEYRLYTEDRSSEYLISTPLPVNGGIITANVPFEINLTAVIAPQQVNLAIANGSPYSDFATGTLKF